MANRKRKSAAQKQRAKERQQQRAALTSSGDGQGTQDATPRRTAPQAQRRPGDRPPRPTQRRGRSSRTSWIVVGVVVVAVAVMVAVFLTRTPGGGGGGTGSQTAVDKVSNVPESAFAAVGAPSEPPSVVALPANTPPVEKDGKPMVLYVGAEYCPYCAAERWAVVAALGRFGTFTDLGSTTSAADDIFPNTPTLTFHGSSYSSDYVSLSAVETQTNKRGPDGAYQQLDTMDAQQSQLFSTYNTKDVTGSNGGIPFTMIGNLYAWAGTQYDPTVLKDKSFDQIATALSDPTSEISKSILGAANQVTAMICQLTNDQPSDVCSADYIQQAQATLPTP
jgi:Domain of unknown function (DUF929)